MQWNQNRILDIIPLGRIAIDFNPTDYYRPLSESITFKRYLGGSPANIAIGMARLGSQVGFIGAVSDDPFGDFVLQYFQAEGIDISHIMRCKNGASLGLAFTEILSKDESNILMYRTGVADLLLESHIVNARYIGDANLILISGTALSMSPSREAALKAVLLAKQMKTPIVFDIDYRPYNWRNDDEIAVYSTFVAQNAKIIIGSRKEYDLMERMIGLDRTDRSSAEYWLSQGSEIVIIKHGKTGSEAFTAHGAYHVKPFPVKLLKGFGGGDGYASAFLNSLLGGKSIEEALEFGSASAAMLVASPACSENMPTQKELLDFISQCKSEIGDIVTRE